MNILRYKNIHVYLIYYNSLIIKSIRNSKQKLMSVKIETRWKQQLNYRDRRTRQKQINIYTIKDPLLNLEFISRKFLKKKSKFQK